MTLTCTGCGATAGDLDAIACAACDDLLAFTLDGDAVEPYVVQSTALKRRMSPDVIDRSGVWRYRELLPPIDASDIVSLREGDVPLYAAGASAAWAGVRRLSYLHLGMNPTSSFKDAGMTVAISRAKARGARVAVCASTGNTAAAMAAYAARAGIVAVVLVPAQGVSEAKVAQTLDYGATVVGVDGDFDDALRTVRAMDPRRVAVVNSVNPWRIEGQKTAAFVLLEQHEWTAPDWLVLPGGNLGNTSAFGKGFREARAIGLTASIPRLAVIQAAGAAPFAQAWRAGTDVVPLRAHTDATAIKIGAPASWKKARAEVQASGGTVTDVDDADIAEARAAIGRDGIGCEPASAASLAGLRRLVAEGTIDRNADIVAVLTGHVLKDGAYAARYHAAGLAGSNRIVRADPADVIERIVATPA